jgi:hypothetical protein
MRIQGNLVVVVYESPDAHKPGHIAIVRPAARPRRLLDENGPSIIQAGEKNYNSTSTKVGFLHLKWPEKVQYFARPARGLATIRIGTTRADALRQNVFHFGIKVVACSHGSLFLNSPASCVRPKIFSDWR